MAKRGRPLGELGAFLAAHPETVGRSARWIADGLAPDVNRELAQQGDRMRRSVGFSAGSRAARRMEGLEELTDRRTRVREVALKSHLSAASLAVFLLRNCPQFAGTSLRTLRRDIAEVRKLAAPASSEKVRA